MSKAPASAAATGLLETDRDHRLAEAYQRMEYLISDISHAATVMEILVSHAFGSTRDEFSEMVKSRIPCLTEFVVSVNSERDFNAAHYAITHVAQLADQLQRDYFGEFKPVQS